MLESVRLRAEETKRGVAEAKRGRRRFVRQLARIYITHSHTELCTYYYYLRHIGMRGLPESDAHSVQQCRYLYPSRNPTPNKSCNTAL